MGEIGTDLAKETADLVLTDDNYVHIRDGVAIGRKAIDNFRKGLTYYLSAKAILISVFIIPLALVRLDKFLTGIIITSIIGVAIFARHMWVGFQTKLEGEL